MFHVSMQIAKVKYVSILFRINFRVYVRNRTPAVVLLSCYGVYVAGPCWGLINCMEQSPS